jgi:hypothetical protein
MFGRRYQWIPECRNGIRKTLGLEFVKYGAGSSSGLQKIGLVSMEESPPPPKRKNLLAALT